MEENDKYSILINQKEFQKMILDCINTGKIDNFLVDSVFVDDKKYKQAIIYGMSIASMLTCLCNTTILKS